jgi:N-acetylmuramic acid 6-phosphate (MurNAc-6-P) etherase
MATTTESASNYNDLELMSTATIIECINREDASVAEAVRQSCMYHYSHDDDDDDGGD